MEVWHMSGAGNDFMVVDARGKQLDMQALSLSLCARTGADGFMALDSSEQADFKLHFYNSDGTRGEMCGNGARCICKFAVMHGVAGRQMSVETDAGVIYGEQLGENQYRVQLNNPGQVGLHCRPDAAYIELGSPGVPHSVTAYPALRWEDREQLRPVFMELRDDPMFPKGVNVNLFRRLTDTSVRILTFERGVEDYTLACGTGSASVAVALWLQGQLPGGHLTVENQGGTLEVTVEGEDGQVNALYLEGPAEILNIYEV